MRKTVANFFLSLDGVMEAPNTWHFPYFNDEMGEAVGAGFASSDAMLMGRVNYQEWAAYWPTSTDQPIADIMNNMPKYVVSTTLDRADWNNTTVIRGDIAAEITALKQSEGKDIAMSGAQHWSSGYSTHSSWTSFACSSTRLLLERVDACSKTVCRL